MKIYKTLSPKKQKLISHIGYKNYKKLYFLVKFFDLDFNKVLKLKYNEINILLDNN